MFRITHTRYRVAQHPKTKKWFVVGYVGDNTYIPISEPLPSRHEAKKRALHYHRAEQAQQAELRKEFG